MPVRKKMVIHLDMEDGTIAFHDEKNEKITEVGDFEAEVGSKNVIKRHECSIVFTHSSPGCVYVKLGGVWYRRCT
jgi:hypothetical protein